jgi:hypothetical protein
MSVNKVEFGFSLNQEQCKNQPPKYSRSRFKKVAQVQLPKYPISNGERASTFGISCINKAGINMLVSIT